MSNIEQSLAELSMCLNVALHSRNQKAAEVIELKRQLEAVTNFVPTPSNIAALPVALREYIESLQESR